MRKIADRCLVLLAALLLLIPALFVNFKPDQISHIENRALAEPVPIQEGLNAFMSALDDSINDRIGFRDPVMQFYNNLYYKHLQGNHGQVIVGKEGWLFFKDSIPEYTGTNYDEETTAYQVSIVKALDEWCRQRDIQLIFAIYPSKTAVYDNYMPDYLQQAQRLRMDLVVEMLEQEGILVTYAKNALVANRDTQELYRRSDTHWNAYGARYALEDMLDKLGLPSYDIPVEQGWAQDGDLQTMLGAGWSGHHSIVATVTPKEGSSFEPLEGNDFYIHSPDTKKIVCYRDSFHLCLTDYYTYYFHGPVIWNFTLDFDYIEQESPDYLLVGFVDRNFDFLTSVNAGVLDLVS